MDQLEHQMAQLTQTVVILSQMNKSNQRHIESLHRDTDKGRPPDNVEHAKAKNQKQQLDDPSDIRMDSILSKEMIQPPYVEHVW
eukprot:3384461-Ditylum_brightwellii.AAC.1